LRQRIAQRLHQRLADGLIDEVARLQRQGVSWQTLEFFGLEYRFVAQHLQGQLDFAELCQQLSQAIGQFAKRQDTWFRRMERQGLVIHWLDGQADPFAQLHQKLRALDLVTTDHRP
jgi:tRNA dimethylallyltransferase